MSYNSKIEWTENTWNPVTGCTKISDGCLNCYAFQLSKRLHAMNNVRYKNGFSITLHNDLIDRPLHWKKPSRIFVNSMSDLFHEDIPDEFICKIFTTMNKATWHNFQILTKRPERMVKLSKKLTWTHNIWQGITVESQKYINRINLLKEIPCNIKFISFEPLLSEIKNIDLRGIHWVIVGGESGIHSRHIEENWILDIKNMCEILHIPFFFKQWGGFNKKKTGYLLQGNEYRKYPV